MTLGALFDVVVETFNRTEGCLDPNCRNEMILLVEITSLLIHKRGKGFFLPAHGRGIALPKDLKRLLRKRPGLWDLPELEDIGSPLDDKGAVAQSQVKSALSFGAERCWYGVNGATGLLQAGLFSMLRPGEAVLLPRNIHRSLIDACLLGDFLPVMFDLPYKNDRGHAFPADKTWLKKVLEEISNKGIKVSAAVLVHPTYHGYASDISSLVKLLHGFGLPVLVDEAHGAHFAIGLGNDLPRSALSAGADLVVHSLHKSSLGLAQTAVLWSQGDRIDPLAIKRSVGCFQTSSPSALLLASCETSLREWKKPSGQRNLLARMYEAKDFASRLKKAGVPILNNDDPFRLILHTAAHGISGFDADKWFISRGLIAELPEPGCLTFCMGFSNHKGLARLFAKIWHQLLESYPNRNSFIPFLAPPIPLLDKPYISSSLAWRSKTITVSLKQALDRVSADLICPYPPGIPILIPGEILDRSRLDWLLEQYCLWPEQIPTNLKVVL